MLNTPALKVGTLLLLPSMHEIRYDLDPGTACKGAAISSVIQFGPCDTPTFPIASGFSQTTELGMQTRSYPREARSHRFMYLLSRQAELDQEAIGIDGRMDFGCEVAFETMISTHHNLLGPACC